MFTLDMNSVIAFSWHGWPLCHDHIRHNYVRDTLRSKRLVSCHEAGHISPNGLEKNIIFNFLQSQSNLKFCNQIRFHNKSTPHDHAYRASLQHFPNCHKTLTVLSSNSSAWPTTLICMNFNVFSFHSIVKMTHSWFVFSSNMHNHKQLCH